MFKRFFFPTKGLIFIFISNSCENKTEVAEAPETEEITVAHTPSNKEIKGELFTLSLLDLKIIKTINKSTKELTTTPFLKGSLKISNNSTNILDIKEMTIQYLDISENPIPYKDGEKKAKVSFYGGSSIQPKKDFETTLDVKVPMAAVKDKSLNKIRTHVDYIPIPLKRESVDVLLKME